MGELPEVRVAGRDPAGGVPHAGDVAVPGHAARAPARRARAAAASAAQGTEFNIQVSINTI